MSDILFTTTPFIPPVGDAYIKIYGEGGKELAKINLKTNEVDYSEGLALDEAKQAIRYALEAMEIMK